MTEEIEEIEPKLVEVWGHIFTAYSPNTDLEIKARPYGAGFWYAGVFHKYEYEVIAKTDIDGYFCGRIHYQGPDNFWEFKIGKQSYKVALLEDVEAMALYEAPTFEPI